MLGTMKRAGELADKIAAHIRSGALTHRSQERWRGKLDIILTYCESDLTARRKAMTSFNRVMDDWEDQLKTGL